MKKVFVISLLIFGFLIMIPTIIPTSLLQSQEKCPTPVINIRFEKTHILELAKKDLTLAFVAAHTVEPYKPVGETVVLHWLPVEISREDLNSQLENDEIWLKQYIERAKKIGRSGIGAAIFHIRMDDLGNNRLKYTITKVRGPHKLGGLNQTSFEMTLDPVNRRYQSSKCLL